MRALVVSILSVAITISATSLAQSIPPDTIRDEAIGWIKVYDFKGATAPVKVDHRLYTAAQLSIGRLIANWIQASYLPTGGLGDVIQSVSEKLGAYNQNTAALPQSYGAYAKIYTDLKYGANRKIERASNSHVIWSVKANGFYGEPADALSTPEHYYFTLPSFAEQVHEDVSGLEKAVDLSRHPVLGQFPAYFQRNSVNGNRKYVLLSKDHRFPFVKITKGEYLDITGAAMARAYTTEKDKISRDNKGNQKSIDYFIKYLNDKHDKRTAVLKNNREKYKDRLQETAEIFTMQPDAMLENYPDVFEGNGGSRLKLPVYTIDPVMAELCTTDAPQWIVVSWTAQLNDPVIKHLHEAVINNFNFEYVYNYFFYPEKVKGQPYTPLARQK
ncbi:MAG: hypothetical protein Q8R69_23760 [Telluria sp.]|nr:hypothetical protein [Telluria sp.]